MTMSGAVLCALCIAVLVLDQGCCDRNNSCSGSGVMEQIPRFIAVKKGRTVSIHCGCEINVTINGSVSWYRVQQNSSSIHYLQPEHDVKMYNCCLTLKNVQKKDNGVYFCKYSTRETKYSARCGTEVMVVGCRDKEITKSMNTMKDTIIVIQTVLIVLFIVVPITLLNEMKKKRSLKIEDHTYEGLEAYQAATYEDIQNVRVLAAKTMEGEHPCLE